MAAFQDVIMTARFQVLREAITAYIKHWIERIIVPLRSSFVEFICVASDEFILIASTRITVANYFVTALTFEAKLALSSSYSTQWSL